MNKVVTAEGAQPLTAAGVASVTVSSGIAIAIAFAFAMHPHTAANKHNSGAREALVAAFGDFHALAISWFPSLSVSLPCMHALSMHSACGPNRDLLV